MVLASDDDDDVERPALPPSDWRALRCQLPQDLRDPVTADDKLIWDFDLLTEAQKPSGACANLEDIYGYYKVVGCSKTTSDAELKEKVEKSIVEEKRKMARYHQDRSATANEQKYSKAKRKWEALKRCRNELCTSDDNGCFARRVNYDKKGEELVESMEETMY